MKNNQTEEIAVRPALFDRVFKPRTVTLPNGHTVQKPVSRMPFIAAIVLAVVFISARTTGFSYFVPRSLMGSVLKSAFG